MSRRVPHRGVLARSVALAILYCACGTATTPRGVTATAAEPGERSGLIVLAEPLPGTRIASPLRIEGRARGVWFFEATFPVSLLDGEGRSIARHYAQARGEWMTESFVPFEAELSFEPPGTPEGVLVLHKANASGLPEHDDQLRIPVTFAH